MAVTDSSGLDEMKAAAAIAAMTYPENRMHVIPQNSKTGNKMRKKEI
jgi:hypothetical protein